MVTSKKNRTAYFGMVVFLISFINVFTQNSDVSNVYVFVAFFPAYYIGFKSIYSFYFIKRKKSLLLNAWLLFSVILLLSELQNGNILNSFFLITIPFAFMELDITVDEFLNSNIVGLIPIVMVTLAAAIMGNRFTSNTVGIITSAFIVLNLISLTYKNNVSLWLKIFYFCSTIIGVFTLVKINSRTSMLTVGISSFVILIHIVYKNMTKIKSYITQSRYKTTIYFFFIVAFLLLVYVVFVLLKIILTPKWRPEDISTGRFEIWATTIKYANLFGHPYDWYITSGLFDTHKGPHNILIGVLAFGGIVGLTLFVMFMIKYLKRLFVEYTKNTSITLMVSIVLITSSLTKGITESMLFEPFYQIYNFFFLYSISTFSDYLLRKDHQLVPKTISYDEFTSIDNYTKKFLIVSKIWFVSVMILGIYGAVFNYNLINIYYIIVRYI